LVARTARTAKVAAGTLGDQTKEDIMRTNPHTSLRTLLGAAALTVVALSCIGSAWATEPPEPDRYRNGTSLEGIDQSVVEAIGTQSVSEIAEPTLQRGGCDGPPCGINGTSLDGIDQSVIETTIRTGSVSEIADPELQSDPPTERR